mmetsp:Transcript_31197/g.31736  ORF Transcript_31197/g.31736 Transcript_31197/m.31736 type:complete len:278 (+) Transcript_31197:46-879(+)
MIIKVFILLLCLNSGRTSLIPRSSKSIIFRSTSRFFTTAGTSALTLLSLDPNSLYSQANADIREQIAGTASILPGYGASDIFYPSFFEGYWTVNRTYSEVLIEAPTFSFVDDAKKLKTKSRSLIYDEHYIEYNNKIVKDRSYSTANYFNALQSTNDMIAKWDISNPNKLSVSSPSFQYDILVTKRSVESIKESTSINKQKVFGYSEFSIISENLSATNLSPPKVFGSRVLVRLREESVNKLRGLERFFVYPINSLDLGSSISKPVVTIKSSFTMTRR